MQQLDDVYLKYSGGLITIEKAEKEMMAIVFESKHLFGLTKLTEDELIDFLIYQLRQFKRILELFDPKKGNFTSFVLNNIHSNLSSWKKMNARQASNRELFFSTCESNMIDDNFKIDQLASEMHANIESQCIHSLNDVMSFIESENQVRRNIQTTTGQQHRYDPLLNFDRNSELRRRCLLVLTLKSCYYIDDDMLNKVSALTEVPIDMLKSMMKRVLDSLDRKIKRREACKRSRDNAYFFTKRYLFEKETFDPNSCWVEFVNTKINKHTQIWNEKNKLLMDNKYRIAPSNKLIGEILGIDDRQVAYIIKQAEKNMDTISLKSYYDDHEDLLSNRKYEQKT